MNITDRLAQDDASAAAVAKAPRVALDDIKAEIEREYYFTPAQAISGIYAELPESLNKGLHVMTVCFMVMKNGFIVIGKSAPASPENYNKEVGQKFAYEDCIRQLWPLMGFALRERLSKHPSINTQEEKS